MTAMPTAGKRPVWDEWYRRVLPAYWVFLFCVTHFPKLQLELGIRASDKIAHLGAFGLLAFLLWRFAESFGRPLGGRFVWLAALGMGVYGALDEWSQPFFNRSADVVDWTLDFLGAVVVLGLLEWRRRRAHAKGSATTPPMESASAGR